MLLVSQTLCSCSRRVGMNAVATAIDRRNGNVDKFSGKGVKSAWFDHHLLDARPLRSSSTGWLASARQKLFTKSDLRVRPYIVEDCFYASVG